MPSSSAPDSLHLRKPAFSNKEGNRIADNWRTSLVTKYAEAFNDKLASDAEMNDYFTYLNTQLVKSTNCEIEQTKYPGGSGFYSHIMTMKSINQIPNDKHKLSNIDTPILILRG